jgi:serine/threonine protein kinase/Flp pilus assembly protein TadD
MTNNGQSGTAAQDAAALANSAGPAGQSASLDDPRVHQAMEEYLRLLQAGERPDRDAFLARYPEVATALAACLQGLDFVHAAGAELSQPASGSADSALPEALGDFRIVRELGRGGMGVVYEAEQRSLKRRVALKVLPLAGILDERRLRRFQNEAQAAASLHHQGIVPVYFVGQERGVHFYAMQLIDGQTLAQMIRQLRQAGEPAPERTTAYEPAPGAAATEPQARQTTETGSGTRPGREHFRRVAELGVQAAEALDYAHQLGIVHRDVKPANLLVDGRGQLWVTDFGLAQVQQAEASLTLTGDLVGTVRYMSPEQALAKRVVVDHRTDVYSLGATLYELLTLEPAFPGTDRQELLRQIAFEEPRPLRRLNKAIPAELETVVLKALEKNPADRYATAQELADDLRRFLEDKPIQARRPSVVQRMRKWARRHKPLVTAAAVCLLVSLTAGIGSAAWVLGERAARQQAAEGKALEALAAAAPGLREGNPHDPALIAAVQRAEAQLDADVLGPELRRQVEQLRRDQQMLGLLEQAHLQAAAGGKDTGFDHAGADRLYAEAFARYGLDVSALEPPEAAERLRASAICIHLVAALDSWAHVKDMLNRGRGAPLRTIADLADANPWRRRVRATAGRGDKAALQKLAEDSHLNQVPADQVWLGGALWDAGNLPAAERLLRRAQQAHPADFWINFELALVLQSTKPGDWEAIRFYQAALALRPQSAAVYNNLGNVWHDHGKLEEAEAAYRKAIELNPDCAIHYCNLGGVWRARGNLADAEATHRKAIELGPDRAIYRCNLGSILGEQGRLDEAITEFREAIRLNKDDAKGHCGLGNALREKGRLDEAIAACREAIRLKRDFADAHNNLGIALVHNGRLDEAIAEYREAIRLKKDFAEAHSNLGAALCDGKRDYDGAIAAFQEAIRVKKHYAEAHHNLGAALYHKGRLDDAIAEFREAIRLKKDYAQAHCNLGHVLRDCGQLEAALESLRRGHELGSRDPQWSFPSEAWVQQCERLVAWDRLLTAVLRGERTPASAKECLVLAQHCQAPFKRFYAAAARFYSDAFTAEPKLSADQSSGHRYKAAWTSALAGCGQGSDAHALHDKQRAQLRRQSLDWLHRELAAWRRRLDVDPDESAPLVQKTMQDWLADPDFKGVRGPEGLKRLPETERRAWQRLWQEVEALHYQAAEQTPSRAQHRPGAVVAS